MRCRAVVQGALLLLVTGGELTSFIALIGQKVQSMNLHVTGATYFQQTAMLPKESYRVERTLPSQGGRP